MYLKCISSVLLVLIFNNLGHAGELFLLTRASEKGVIIPHAGVVVKYDNGNPQWLHFGIKNVQADLADAIKRKWVDGDTRHNKFPINHLAGFKIDDTTLRRAVSEIQKEFSNAKYKWGKNGRDCVTCATRMCAKCGLRTTKDQDYSAPKVMWESITLLNRGTLTEKIRNIDNKPNYKVPWKR